VKRRAVDFAILIALAAAAVFFWQYRIIDPAEQAAFKRHLANIDFFTYTYPVAAAAARSFREGEIPLWNPFQFAGQPFLASVPGGVLYPLNFHYLLFPIHVAIEWMIIWHLIAAGLFMYLYGRAIPLRPVAAAGAALTFMFSGFVSAQAVWFIPALAACVWLPLGFLAIEKIFGSPRSRWVILLGVAVAMPILAGWPQTWTYSMYAMALYSFLRFLARALRPGQRKHLVRIAVLLAAGVTLGLSLAAIQLLPSYELQSLGSRRAGAISELQSLVFGAATPAQLMSDAANPDPGRPRWIYLGMSALLLVPLSLFSRSGWWRILCLWCLLVCGLGVALTIHTPFFALFRELPTGSWFRAPWRMLFLYAFSASVLTGIAIDALAGMERGGSKLRLLLGSGVVTASAVILTFMETIPARGLVYLWVTVGVLWFSCLLPSPRLRLAPLMVLVGLLGWDLFHATSNPSKHPYHVPMLLSREQPLLNYLKANQRLYRTYIYNPSPPDYAMMEKQGTLNEIYSVTDYEPLSLARYSDFFRLLDPRETWKSDPSPFTGKLNADPSGPRFELMELMSVRYIVVHEGAAGFRRALSERRPSWRRILRRLPSRYVVYENTAPLPRAYLAFDWVSSAGGEEALKAIAAPDFDPRRMLVIEGLEAHLGSDPRGRGGDLVPAQIVSYRPSRIVVDSSADRAGYLVLTDTFYPGWKVTVDGRRERIFLANYLFRAVPVEAGRHRLIFTYEPIPYRVGAAMTVSALCAIALCAALGLYRASQARRAAGG
jgi:hypothetical protein